jgi:hypothetical protein
LSRIALLATKDTVNRRVFPENVIGGSVVEVEDLIEVSYGPILLLRIVDLVETGPDSQLAALVKVARAGGRATGLRCARTASLASPGL